jgi:RNA polymerase-binding transcription factor DksA
MIISQLALSYARHMNDGELEREVEDAIATTINEQRSQSGLAAEKKPEKCCSFCGKAPPDVRLGAGPDAFICNECVSIFSEIFEKKES